jgi:hypothetical protein
MPPPRSSRYTPPKGTEAEEKLGLVIGQAEDLDPQAKADAEVIKWMGSYGAQWSDENAQWLIDHLTTVISGLQVVRNPMQL